MHVSRQSSRVPRAPWVLPLVAVAAALCLAACAPRHYNTDVAVPSRPAAVPGGPATSGPRIAVQRLTVTAPKAGDVLTGVVAYTAAFGGIPSRPAAANVYHAGADLEPLVRNALAPSVLETADSPYLMQVTLDSRFSEPRHADIWGFEEVIINTTRLSVTVLEGDAEVFADTYEATAEDTYSLYLHTFPPPEIYSGMLQSAVAEAVQKMVSDPELQRFRAAGRKT